MAYYNVCNLYIVQRKCVNAICHPTKSVYENPMEIVRRRLRCSSVGAFHIEQKQRRNNLYQGQQILTGTHFDNRYG